MTQPAPDTDFFCSLVSRRAGEPIYGTAPQVSTWFLLEYPGRWERKTVKNNDLPEPVQQRLDSYLNYIPNSRLLFIRQRPRVAPPGIHFFVARTHEDRQVIHEFRLPDYDALLRLDLGAIAEGDDAYAAQRRDQPLFVICMHGRRDRCCPLNGLPVHVAMMQHGGPAVWQASHVGGHRFSPNLISFPDGVYYGRVSPEGVRELMNASRDGRLTLDRYRGRACYPKPAQAADYFVRQATGQTALDAFRLLDAAAQPDGTWITRFEQCSTGEVHRLHVVEEDAGYEVYGSCGDAEPEPARVFRLIARTREDAPDTQPG